MLLKPVASALVDKLLFTHCTALSGSKRLSAIQAYDLNGRIHAHAVVKLVERVVEVLHPGCVVVRIRLSIHDRREVLFVDAAKRVPARHEPDHLAHVEALFREGRGVRREILLRLGDALGASFRSVDATSAEGDDRACTSTNGVDRAEGNEVGH